MTKPSSPAPALHTPGPWVAGGLMQASNFAKHVAAVHADGCVMVRVRGGVKDDKKTALANARLIAAAPAMLAELERLAEKYGEQLTFDICKRAKEER